jgi:hypothetical protein
MNLYPIKIFPSNLFLLTFILLHKCCKREGVSHHIHAYGGDNFKITLGGAQGHLADALIRVRHWGHILTRLVTSHEFHVYSAYVAKNIIIKSMRQPPSLLKIFEKGRRWTPMIGPSLLLLLEEVANVELSLLRKYYVF